MPDAKNWLAALARTRQSAFGRIATLFGATELTDSAWDDLEALLLQADLGLETATALLNDLRTQSAQFGWTKTAQLKDGLRASLAARLLPPPPITWNPDGPTVILIVGVNGSGKTTTAAKLGARYQAEGRKILLAAADTYRAAAIEQLQTWGQRLNLRVIAGQPDGDPGAVAYDAVASAISRREDILLIDTAGRLHTRFNLMEELEKVHRVVAKSLPGAPHHTWLVLDATTGQNALQQARAFKEAVAVTGVILAKLDSSARGGMAFAIHSALGLPILFAGLGEAPEDLTPFDPAAFIQSILADFG
ncbi:MAG: signal recognition particle-docking protein FtsY [Anaerolineae bacterium]|nr:MAG: signal recognition particle-docking protein FtsY [Anaerolineae bacterium]